MAKAKELNISVDADINKRIAEIQTQSKIVDPDKFHEWVREQSGMTFEDFRQQLKNQLLTQRVIGQEIQRTIVIPEPEKKKYYEEHKNEFVREEEVYLSQIFISTEGKTPEQAAAAEKKAKSLVDRARKGEKFGELARDNSDDPETAKNFGEMPPYKRGQLRKEIEDIVFTQKKGYRHRSDQGAQRLHHPEDRRALREGAGPLRCRGRDDHGAAGRAEDAAETARVSD